MGKVLESLMEYLVFVPPISFVCVIFLSLRNPYLKSHHHKNSLNVTLVILAFVSVLGAVVYYI